MAFGFCRMEEGGKEGRPPTRGAAAGLLFPPSAPEKERGGEETRGAPTWHGPALFPGGKEIGGRSRRTPGRGPPSCSSSGVYLRPGSLFPGKEREEGKGGERRMVEGWSGYLHLFRRRLEGRKKRNSDLGKRRKERRGL